MKQAKVLSEKEQQIVFNVAKRSRYPKRNTLMLMLGFYGGLRAVEIANLRVHNVLDENGEINEQVYLDATQTKGNKSRVIYLNKKVRKCIKDYIACEGLADKREVQLLRTQLGGGFTSATVRQAMKHLFAESGISNASSHSGRRTCLTTLANKGVGVHVIREIAGHSNLATTQKYLEVSSDKLSSAVELL